MTRTEYIDFNINKLFELYPNLSDCLYAFDELSDTHFICICDKPVYKSEDFMKFSAETSLSYYSSGFSGTIAFISNIEGMEYLEFHPKKNTYLIKQDLIETMFFHPMTNDNWMTINNMATNLNLLTTPLTVNPISTSFFTFSYDIFRNSLMPYDPSNENWIYKSDFIRNSLLTNPESFHIEPDEDLFIALAA